MTFSERNTILFDLDGTLLPIDFDCFLERYFKALTAEFTDLASPEKFIKILMEATQKMIENDGRKTNQEVFIENFTAKIKVNDLDQLMNRFETFYYNKFPHLKEGLELDDTATELVFLLKEQGFQLAVVTNPLFPKMAIVERMRWIGLDPTDFQLITNYEEMHYSKPNLSFFQEVMEKLEVSPEKCIMIGNDVQEDMVAGELGLATFLVEDYLIDRKQGQFIPDWRGSLLDLIDFFEKRKTG